MRFVLFLFSIFLVTQSPAHEPTVENDPAYEAFTLAQSLVMTGCQMAQTAGHPKSCEEQVEEFAEIVIRICPLTLQDETCRGFAYFTIQRSLRDYAGWKESMAEDYAYAKVHEEL